MTLLYQDLVEQKQLTADHRLPPVLPIVLYNGEPRWNAARDLLDLIEPVPGGLEAYRPRLRYLLLDEGAIVDDPAYPSAVRNLVSALFQLEHARDESTWLVLYRRLMELLDDEAIDSLKRAFGRWIYKSYIAKKRPGIRLPDINDYHEVHKVLQERVEQWNRQLREQGRVEGRMEGRTQGRLEGRMEGETRVLARQLRRRFGELSARIEERLANADEADLERWADAVLDADTLEQIFSAPAESH